VELIVRAAQNRKLDDDKLLFAAAADWREFGRWRFVFRRIGRANSLASHASASRRAGVHHQAGQPAPVGRSGIVTLTLVEVHEIDPPKP